MLPTRILALVHASLVLLTACQDAPPPPPTPTAAPVTASSTISQGSSAITRVTASSLVCMVNDRFMGSEQIPVSVDGKTYYGCCAACKDKLQNNPAARTALDPLTQRPVDKATAVVGKTASGKVVYFESEDTFARYAARD